MSANMVAILHILVVMWLCTGFLLALLSQRFALWHWLSIAATVVLRTVYSACPLTLWQKGLEDPHGQLGGVRVEVPNEWLGIHLTGPQTTATLWVIFVISTYILLYQNRKKAVIRTKAL